MEDEEGGGGAGDLRMAKSQSTRFSCGRRAVGKPYVSHCCQASREPLPQQSARGLRDCSTGSRGLYVEQLASTSSRDAEWTGRTQRQPGAAAAEDEEEEEEDGFLTLHRISRHRPVG